MALPLARVARDGTEYARPQPIEVLIDGIVGISVEELTRRGSIRDPEHGDYFPPEVLVPILRLAHSERDDGRVEAVFRLLTNRVERRLRRRFPGEKDHESSGLRDEILDRFVDLLATGMVATGMVPGSLLLDDDECRFDSAFANFIVSSLRRRKPAGQPLPLFQKNDPDRDMAPGVQEAADRFFRRGRSKFEEKAFRFRILQAIRKLPTDQTRVVFLLLDGFPIDSKDEKETTIARILGCTEKTARNRRDRAYAALRENLKEEAEG